MKHLVRVVLLLAVVPVSILLSLLLLQWAPAVVVWLLALATGLRPALPLAVCLFGALLQVVKPAWLQMRASLALLLLFFRA